MSRMLVKATLAVSIAAALLVQAAEYGTAAEAKAMLDKTVAGLKVDKPGTLAKITKGEGGFRDRDLYPFCGGPDGIYTATPNPSLVGKSMRDQKDKVGKPIGQEFYSAVEGKVTEVSYMWPRPGSTEPVQKKVYCTKTGDQTCCVGYYEQP